MKRMNGEQNTAATMPVLRSAAAGVQANRKLVSKSTLMGASIVNQPTNIFSLFAFDWPAESLSLYNLPGRRNAG
jgi:hypothetical protein